MEISSPCPWCRAAGRDRSGDNLKVNLRKRTYQCFSCGARPKTHGPLDSHYYGGTIGVAKEPQRSERWHPRPLLPAIRSVVARAYLKGRGVTKQQLVAHDEIRYYAGCEPLYSNRIFFLFPDYRYWQARAMFASKRKYVNAPGDKGGALFKCEHGREPLIIVEGVFDALAVERVGFKAVSLLGKTASQQQILNVAAICENVVVLLDSDAPSSARKLAFQLMPYAMVLGRDIEGQQDPADMGDERLARLLRRLE